MSAEFITIIDCCREHHIETSFIYSLRDAGLIEVQLLESEEVIDLEQLPALEQFIRLHYELDINTEGIDSIRYLLDKIIALKQENNYLKSRLRLYEH